MISFRLLLAVPALAASLAGPLDTPATAPYDPVDLLCKVGNKENPKWCKDWVSCIKSKASPAGSPKAVMDAWQPATCKEICGDWPSIAPPDRKKSFLQASNATAALLESRSQGDCIKSCSSFQSSLSSCVATILFEPGKIAGMGMPAKGGKSPPAHCTKKDTPCMPDLNVNHQKCLGHRTKKVLDKDYKVSDKISQECKLIKMNVEDCKKCPQLQDNYQSQYAAFTGGCLDQLHSYWAATHPRADNFAIPGGIDCRVH